MRIVALLPSSLALVSALLFAACGSDPASPDPGKEGENGVGGAGGSVAAYPAGPYGNTVGSILKDFSFEGWTNPKEANYVADKANLTTISMHDFYNPTCDPAKPRALLLTASALWCSACKEEAKTTMKNYNYWHPKGVQFLTTIFEDADYNPAEYPDLTTWAKTYSLEYPTVLDPSLKLGAFFSKSASPFNMVVDTCTMQIKVAMEGVLDTGTSNLTFKALVGE